MSILNKVRTQAVPKAQLYNSPLQGKEHRKHSEDLALAHRIAQGHRMAFDELYTAHAPRLLRRVHRMLGEATQAEDCLQQIFLIALKNISKYRGDGPLQNWLERIATTEIMGVYRKQYRQRSFKERLHNLLPTFAQGNEPESDYWQAERVHLVHHVLKQLEPSKRMTLTLCMLEGLTIEETADRMSVPVGTATSRLYHGKKAFRKQAIAAARRMNVPIEEWFHE